MRISKSLEKSQEKASSICLLFLCGESKVGRSFGIENRPLSLASYERQPRRPQLRDFHMLLTA